MKRLQLILLLLFFIPISSAQVELGGTWQGNLVVAPGSEILVQFIIEEHVDGSLSAVLNAPDQPTLTNITVNSINFTQQNLVMSVEEISGTFEGRLEDGSFQGTWTQEGSSFPLVLSPYVEPVLSQQAMESLIGAWVGELRPIPGGDLAVTIVFRFEFDDQGEFVAYLDSPDEGQTGIAVDNVALVEDKLSIEVKTARLKVTGNISGNTFTGEWKQGNRALELELERGGEIAITALELSPDAMERLQGPWHGKIDTLNIQIRFEVAEGGQIQGFLDSPDQGASGIAISTASVENNRLSIEINVAGASFTGEIGANEIVGTWIQGGSPKELTLIRGPYIPAAAISAETMEQVSGIWKGKVNETELIFSFSTDEQGEFLVTLDVPAMGAVGLSINNVVLEGDDVSWEVPGIAASFAGKFAVSSITGSWTFRGVTSSVELMKE